MAAGATDQIATQLASLGVNRPLLVTDRGLVRAGIVDRVTAAIGRGASLAVFDGVTENPVFADADAGAAMYAGRGCDGVIALGGGSVIDTAKYIALLATHGGGVARYAGVPEAAVGATAPLIAMPTTAGTGSEANGTAGIHPTSTTTAVGVDSPHLLPRLVILDPELTISLPAKLTAATGIDALSHCVEGYLSRNDNPIAKSIALDGAGRAVRHVRRAYADPRDMEARTEMMTAAFAGGVAIGMGLGPAHAIAITCGDQGFHHGVLSGIGLVAAIDTMAAHQPVRAGALKYALGIGAGDSIAAVIASLMRSLELPGSLGELRYVAADVPELARAAHRSFFNSTAWHRPNGG